MRTKYEPAQTRLIYVNLENELTPDVNVFCGFKVMLFLFKLHEELQYEDRTSYYDDKNLISFSIIPTLRFTSIIILIINIFKYNEYSVRRTHLRDSSYYPIYIAHSCGISNRGLQGFFSKSTNKVTDISLDDIKGISYEYIITHVEFVKDLIEIDLNQLVNVSDYGIIYLMEKAVSLEKLVISEWPLTMEEMLCHYVKIKHTEFKYEYEYKVIDVNKKNYMLNR
ncbi:hypothetical protein BDA99DRAFT_538280 [Phascolomyces articulosus]|uniref:Uncharacterized protein n=1 Tax=Phascolomyces articulosus TaxID=60185 RepID=A0AAD5K867_9FUNG|nr:hypothetical protein BDA99DRAFT_538280 [Phascolomyces articulosus]